MKLALTALTLAVALGTSPSRAEVGAELGVLTCKLTDVKNDIVYTDETFACEFKPKSGAAESYTGQIKSLGLDLSVTTEMTLVWGVLAPKAHAGAAQSLRGTYVGGSAAVALGAGAGANVLVGGGENSITLQPISVTGILGSGASLGIEEFELD